MATPLIPLDEHEYPVILGTSLIETDDDDDNVDQLNEQQCDNVMVSFGYEFLPASVDKSTPGLVSVDDSNGVQVLMGSSTGATGGVCFKGKLVEHKETDCMLIFDGKGFRLERCLFSCMQLRHVRAHTPRQRVKSQPEQANDSDANATLVASKETSISVASVTGTAKKRPAKTRRRAGGKVNAPETAKGKRGRPKGSTKAAIASKQTQLKAIDGT
ncbi:unnamed protein product [Peronospora farinosa]|uniref:Transcription elongation factor Eaf N-terminal domain-containing protein n=1 Tax=Peronospora farinosa TaxID=134698 RepID=A0AAV0SNY2_9STRA|nr:unnamed protein product [Peronospora farinosa]CAI5704737.1 unnamed protein product [Peronospora farinosa]